MLEQLLLDLIMLNILRGKLKPGGSLKTKEWKSQTYRGGDILLELSLQGLVLLVILC